MTIDPCDPMLTALPDLSTTAAHDARVRACCHAAMASAAPRLRRRWPARLIDAGLAAAVVLYGGSTALEALRVFISLD